ncbi:MAG: AMP-binding protein [Rhizobiales bacterium]|nr:AMP-binding protein [Hyphomicrobiales bacterium]
MFALMAGSTTALLPEVDAAKAVSAIMSHRVTKLLLVPAVIRMLVEFLELRPVDTSSVTTLCFGASPMPEELIARIRALFPFVGLSACCRAASPSCRLDIVDPEGRSLAPFTRGEIVYCGPQLMTGYWNKPEATENPSAGLSGFGSTSTARDIAERLNPRTGQLR